MRVVWLVFVVCILLTAVILGCVAEKKPEPGGSRHLITVSIPPLKNFTETVGGDHVEVLVLLPPGAEPHSYEPSARDIVEASGAELIIATGTQMPFEQHFITRLAEVRNDVVVVNTSAGIPIMDNDPHIWLSPRNAKVMVTHITSALCEHDRQECGEFQSRRDVLLQDLDALDLNLQTALAPARGTAFLVTHPAWGYFAREYGLTQIAIESEGKEPSSGEIASLIAAAQAQDIRIVFVEPQFSPREAEVVARQINGTVVQVDPLAEAYIPNLEYVGSIIGGGEG
ncbi:MAG: zinc ABC transporter substrate-binding protein [Methanomicrobiales archaeon]|nr:zinc ABC transporter substrate-binding protein [Methanomicrobiales archaeon]